MDWKEAKERQEEEERINDFKKLVNIAYDLFDGKYSMEYLNKVPYKILLREMDREEKEISKHSKEKAQSKMAKQLKTLGLL